MKLIGALAEEYLREYRGGGTWELFETEKKRPVMDDDYTEGLSAGDVIFMFDTDMMRFDEAKVVHVDCHGVAWYIEDTGGDSPPRIYPVMNWWAKSKREALFSVNEKFADVLKELTEVMN